MPPSKPDPGRMTAHRLNRNEYTNTIRDLLGIRFRAERDFPADDSADGFDNIGDVLTVSPLLMERYLSAAERIAGWALATDNLPAKPLEIGYLAREQRIRRTDRSTIEAEHRVEFAGEYIVRFGLPGRASADRRGRRRAGDARILDGRHAARDPDGRDEAVRPRVLQSVFRGRSPGLYLPEGDHVFRAGFIDDAFIRRCPARTRTTGRRTSFSTRSSSSDRSRRRPRKKPGRGSCSCNPESGRACVETILADLARRAYRRPPTRARS